MKTHQSAFTLIELIIVIAILSFVSVIGIKQYGNIREVQAKKMNVANLKRLGQALATYETVHLENGTGGGFFNYFDSLCDVDPSGPNGQQMGTAGTATKWGYDGTAAKSGDAGIYDGSWKNLIAVKNAAGVGSDAPPTLEYAKDQNRGTRETGLLTKLGVYYLTAADAKLLQDAGLTYVLYHNPSTGQSSSYFNPTNFQDGVSFGGGPGFRPDMSAYCPGPIQAGAAVAMIVPGTFGKDGTFTGSTIYSDFGYPVKSGNASGVITSSSEFVGKAPARLVAFGIGKSAECVRNKVGLGEAPYNPVYDKKHYRQYVAVFALTTGGQGVAGTCHFVGVLDCAGNTYRAADYNINWATQLN